MFITFSKYEEHDSAAEPSYKPTQNTFSLKTLKILAIISLINSLPRQNWQGQQEGRKTELWNEVH